MTQNKRELVFVYKNGNNLKTQHLMYVQSIFTQPFNQVPQLLMNAIHLKDLKILLRIIQQKEKLILKKKKL